MLSLIVYLNHVGTEFMQKIIITFGFCLFTFCLFAQTNYPFFNNMKGERKIIADTVITRVAPSTGAAFEDTLYFGNAVEILMTVPYTEVRNNMVSPWLKVVYQKGKFKKIAFVSAIDVALNDKLTYKNYEFVWGVIANNKKDSFVNNELTTKNNYACKLVAMRDAKRVAVSEFEVGDKDSSTIQIVESKKLSNSICLLVIDAVDKLYPKTIFYTNHFVLCSDKLIKLPHFEGIDGIDKLSTYSSVIFPKKNIIQFWIHAIGPKNSKLVQTYKWANCNYTFKWSNFYYN